MPSSRARSDTPATLPLPPRTYLGIDPGASGGMVALTGTRVEAVALKQLTRRGIWEWINGVMRPVIGQQVPGYCVIERVGGFIQGNPAPGSAMFNFGVSYGELLMALTAAGIPHEDVPPQKWQKAMGISPRNGKGGESKPKFKKRLKEKAQQLFPEVKVTNWLADALLLAEYARRSREGTL